MPTRNLFRTLAPLLVATVALSAIGAPPREIVVGQVVDYAGRHGEASRDYVAGAKVYFDTLNSRGGMGGVRIRHIVLDGAASADDVRSRTRELLGERKADVLFGYVGDETIEAAESVLRETGIAHVGPLAGRDAPAALLNRTFFTRPGYEAEVRQIVSHFRALQLTRFAVVKAGDAGWAGAVIERSLAELGLKSAGTHTLGSVPGGNAADVAATLRLNAQAIVVVADTVETAEFMKRFRPLDPGAMVVALSTVNHRTIFELLGPKVAHGVLITQVVPNPLLPDTAILKEHIDAMKVFRDEPPSHLTLEGFIAAKVLVEGLRRAGSNPSREAILGAFQQMKRVDVKGLVIDLTPGGRTHSTNVDIALIRRNGNLLQ